jgi:hypothetical protein
MRINRICAGALGSSPNKPLPRRVRHVPWYTFSMSSLLDQVVRDLRALSCEEQDRPAKMLLTFPDGCRMIFG